MKKHLLTLLTTFALAQCAFANNPLNFISFEVHPQSYEALLYEIEGFMTVGPIQPGTKFTVDETHYEQMKGHFVKITMLTQDSHIRLRCPSTYVSGGVMYQGVYYGNAYACSVYRI